MISKIKYVLFDYSNNFKNDFMKLFKKSIAFLIIGIIFFALNGVNETFGFIGSISLIIFGIMWCRNILVFLTGLSLFPKNVILKWTCMLIAFMICFCLGYIYFLWCSIKMLIIFVKKATKKDSNAVNDKITKRSDEFYKYCNEIDKMSYNELDEMHQKLAVIAMMIPILTLGLPGVENDQKLLTLEEAQRKELSDKDKIYGCLTYGDAEELNHLILKKLESLESNPEA